MSQTGVTLSWAASTDDVAVAGYDVFLNGSYVGSTKSMSYAFSGLSCGTTYTLGVLAYDGWGSQSSRASTSASTASCPDTSAPSAPTGLVKTAATSTSISISWLASLDNVGVAGYDVFVNGGKAGSSASTSYSLPGLSCGTTYSLGVVAFDAAGNRSSQASTSAGTAACSTSTTATTTQSTATTQLDESAPSVPQDERVTGTTQTAATLAWSAATDNVGVTGYTLYLNGVKVATTTQTSYTYTGLACATTYTVGLEAFDAAGNHSDNIFASGPATTTACSTTATTTQSTATTQLDESAPSVPQDERVTGTTQTTATLAWSAATDNVGVTGYTLYLNGVKVATTTQTSYTYTGLACATTYTVGLEAFDAAGNHSDKIFASGPATTTACSTADTQAPATPSTFAVSAATQISISVAWTASTDNVGVAGYGRYQNGSLVSSGTGTTYTFTGLTCGTSFTLAIDAYDAAGNRSAKTSLTASTSACADTTPPTAPASLTATSSASQVALSWAASSDAGGIAGYSVYRSTTSGFTPSSSNRIAEPTGTSYTDSGLATGTYYYRVTANDLAGNTSAASSQASATVAASAPAGPVAAYGFDEGSGTSVADASGNGNSGSLSNTTWAGPGAGRFGNALSFNGTDSWVSIADSSSLDLTSGLTIEGWVKPSAGNEIYRTVLVKEQPGNVVYGLYANSETDRPQSQMMVGSPKILDGTSGVPLGQWTYLSTTFDGTTERLYVNGTQVASMAVTGAIATSSSPVRIGGNSIWDEWFNGLIDEVRIYNRALSSSTIQADMATPVGGAGAGGAAADSGAGGVSSDPTAPSAPGNLVTTAATANSIALSWTASTDDVAVAGYGHYQNGTLLSSGTATSYTFTGLSCGTSYTLAIDAFDAAGNRSAKSSVTAATSACADTQAPSAPTGLVKTAGSATSLSLSWLGSSDNVGVSGYSVYVDDVLSGTSATTSYTVSGLTCGTSYALAVDAFDAAGNRSAKTSLTTSTAACADTTPPTAPGGLTATASASQVALSWSASTDAGGIARYNVYRSTTSGFTPSASNRIAQPTGTSYTDSGLAAGTYYYKVTADDNAGNTSASSGQASATISSSGSSDTTAPSPPSALSVGSVSQTGLTLSWGASTDNVAVAGYDVFVNGTKAGSTAAATYALSGLTCGTTYTLGVVAFDAAGNRSAQGTISATTSACSSSASLWVDTNGGSCVRQASGSGYVDAQACSWNQAYQAAQTGDVIVVKGGNYGNVSIGPNKASIAAPGVTFRTATGESVTVNDLENGAVTGAVGGNNINFVGPVTARTFRTDGTSNITVDNWRVDCGGCDGVQIFHVEKGNNVRISNSDISDNQNNSLIWIDGSNITFEHDVIHDAALPGGSSAHTECMYVNGVTNLTLKRNHFYHCAVMDVFITGSDVSGGGYVENNVFEKPWESTGVISNGLLAFQFRTGGPPSPDPNNWDFRYNTFVGPLNIDSSENPVGSGGMRVIGNVFLASAPCGLSNTTYDYNAFLSGTSCGSHVLTATLATLLAGFTSIGDPGTYSLTLTSILRDMGDPASYPSQDLAGTSRYKGAAPDLGAYEGP